MKAAQIVEPNRIEIVEKPVPIPKPGELLVRVRRVGICGSDVHMYRGEHIRDQLPRIPGHEFAGEIVDTCGSCPDFKVGDLVTADINGGCGRCTACRTDSPMLCREVHQIGIHSDGAFAEYLAIPTNQAIRLTSGMTAAMGALLEPAGCVARSLRRCRFKAADSILVMGAGPMGMLHVQLAKSLGASMVVVLEANERLAKLALKLGADHAATSVQEISTIGAEVANRGGFDVVAECVGKKELCEIGVRAVRPGGTLCSFGLERIGVYAKIAPFDMVMQEKTIVGSVGASMRDMRSVMDLLASGALDVSNYTSAVYPLAQVELAIHAFSVEKIALKVQLVP